MGLIAADAEVDADVASFGGDEFVDGANLVFGGFGVFGQIVGAGAKSVSGLRLTEGERAVPVADFSPVVEGGPGDGGKLAAVGVFVGIFGGRGLGVFGGGFGGGHELGDFPGPGAEAIVNGDGGVVVGAPDLDVFVGGNFEGEDFGRDDVGAGRGEMVGSPELARGFGLVDGDEEIVLEGVADGEGANGDVLLFEVAVEGSFAGDGGGHVDGVGGGRVDGRAVGLVDADELDGGGFVGGGVAEGEDTELLGCSLGLDVEDGVDFALAGAVGVHAVAGFVFFEDEGFAGEGTGGCDGGRRGCGLSGCGGLLRGRDKRQKQNRQDREQKCAGHLRISLIRAAGYSMAYLG